MTDELALVTGCCCGLGVQAANQELDATETQISQRPAWGIHVKIPHESGSLTAAGPAGD